MKGLELKLTCESLNLWKIHLVSIEYETTTAGWIGGHQLDPVERVVPGRGKGSWVRLENIVF